MRLKSVRLSTLLWVGILMTVLYIIACKKEVNITTQSSNVDTLDITDTTDSTDTTQDTPINTDTISRIVLFENNTNGIRQFRIPGLVKTNKGTLIAVCDARVNKFGDLPNKINTVLRRSIDDGKTWSEMQTIVEFSGNEGAGDPALLVDRKTNTVWLFFNYAKEGIGISTSQPGYGENTIHIMAIKSDDDGLTWSKPIDITKSVKAEEWRFVVSSPGHGIQLKDGTLLQMAYYGLPKSVTWKMSAFAFYSKDHGKTWKRTEPIGQGLTEAMAVELENGQVMVNIRNQVRFPNKKITKRAITFIADLTRPWSEVQYDTVLTEPSCQGSMIKLEVGESAGKDWLVFGNPAHHIERQNYTLRFSKNGGKEWATSLQLWPGGSMYSDIVELQNGDFGVLYEKYVASSFYLEFARVPRELLIKD